MFNRRKIICILVIEAKPWITKGMIISINLKFTIKIFSVSFKKYRNLFTKVI